MIFTTREIKCRLVYFKSSNFVFATVSAFAWTHQRKQASKKGKQNQEKKVQKNEASRKAGRTAQRLENAFLAG